MQGGVEGMRDEFEIAIPSEFEIVALSAVLQCYRSLESISEVVVRY